MTDLDSDEYDWRRRLSHTNMTGGGGGFVAAGPVTNGNAVVVTCELSLFCTLVNFATSD